MKRIAVTLLSGFPGGGKMTLLASQPARLASTHTALIVNESGAVSIDHRVGADLADNITECGDGYLCCTTRGDLVLTRGDRYRMCRLDDVPRSNRVIVENAGVAEPILGIHTLMADRR